MKRPDRAERLAWVAAHHAALVTFSLCLPIFLGAEGIASLMLQGKPDVVAQASLLIRWLCVTEIFFAYAMVAIGAMQGAGDTKRPLWITIASLWCLRVPLTYLLALSSAHSFLGWGAGLGPQGAWIAMSSSQAVQGVLALWMFKQGAWKRAKV